MADCFGIRMSRPIFTIDSRYIGNISRYIVYIGYIAIYCIWYIGSSFNSLIYPIYRRYNQLWDTQMLIFTKPLMITNLHPIMFFFSIGMILGERQKKIIVSNSLTKEEYHISNGSICEAIRLHQILLGMDTRQFHYNSTLQ